MTEPQEDLSIIVDKQMKALFKRIDELTNEIKHETQLSNGMFVKTTIENHDNDIIIILHTKEKPTDIYEFFHKIQLSSPQPKEVFQPSTNYSLEDWVVKNTRFPVGTTFKGQHLGVEYIGVVKDSGLVLNGKKYQSPSAAAMSITNTQTNGWGFWDCLFPNTTEWRRIASIRRKL